MGNYADMSHLSENDLMLVHFYDSLELVILGSEKERVRVFRGLLVEGGFKCNDYFSKLCGGEDFFITVLTLYVQIIIYTFNHPIISTSLCQQLFQGRL